MAHELRPLTDVLPPNAYEALLGLPAVDLRERKAAAPLVREWLTRSPVESLTTLTDMANKAAEVMRTGLHRKIDEVLDGLPAGAVVAVSPPDMGDPQCGTVRIAYMLRPLPPGMPVPDGWMAYSRR